MALARSQRNPYSEGSIGGSAEPDYRHHHEQPPDDQRFLDQHLDVLHALDKRLVDLLTQATSITDRLMGTRPQAEGEDPKQDRPSGLVNDLQSRTTHLALLLDALQDELIRISRI